MERIKIDDPYKPNRETINHIVKVIDDGGIVAFPSDTVFGLMAKVGIAEIAHVNTIKNRQSNKNYALILNNIKNSLKLFDLDKITYNFINQHTPGLFTFIVKPGKILNNNIHLLLSDEGKIGIRVPESDLMRQVASKFLLFATSANLSGQPSVYTVSELKKQIDINLIDLVVDYNLNSRTLASTVIDISGDKPTILRQGSGILN